MLGFKEKFSLIFVAIERVECPEEEVPEKEKDNNRNGEKGEDRMGDRKERG